MQQGMHVQHVLGPGGAIISSEHNRPLVHHIPHSRTHSNCHHTKLHEKALSHHTQRPQPSTTFNISTGQSSAEQQHTQRPVWIGTYICKKRPCLVAILLALALFLARTTHPAPTNLTHQLADRQTGRPLHQRHHQHQWVPENEATERSTRLCLPTLQPRASSLRRTYAQGVSVAAVTPGHILLASCSH